MTGNRSLCNGFIFLQFLAFPPVGSQIKVLKKSAVRPFSSSNLVGYQPSEILLFLSEASFSFLCFKSMQMPSRILVL